MNAGDTKKLLSSAAADRLFARLYGPDETAAQRKRYEGVIDGFLSMYGEEDFLLFSSPGRTEIAGNHTDHNHGKVLGGSINLDCVSAAGKNDAGTVRIFSEGFDQQLTIRLDDLEPGETKTGSEVLVKGMLAGFKKYGYAIGGFDAYITSNVISSAGVSSSAAFETLICQIINTFFNDGKIDKTMYAQIGKYSENVYWDKASGLLDQMCCAVGGLITIDFADPVNPDVRKVNFDFESAGHSVIIVQTGRGHADLSEDYSSIPKEMKAVAECLGKQHLSETSEEEMLSHLQEIREKTGDRAILRAIHFFEENKRVENDVKALEGGRFNEFLKGITASGNSSWKYLQNCYTNHDYQEQGITVALALTELFLEKKGCGACRVHGGGFAGVILAIVPNEITDEYISYMEKHLGEGCAYRMAIRPIGSCCVNEEIG
ncbi:MAG: galactokinase [Lachnospiraceae bacterium]|nr:galactokinase [Lachnospiraceae bacterium]MCI1726994.1 galactokinase [Lachnospiraceae bacterium]